MDSNMWKVPAYVYTARGKDLRAFNVSETHATELLALLKQELPLQ